MAASSEMSCSDEGAAARITRRRSGSAGPDQAVPALDFDQGGVDRRREAGVVQLDRKVSPVLAGGLPPGGAELGLAREDAVVRRLVVRLIVRPEGRRLDVESEGLNRPGVAVALDGEGSNSGHVSLSFASGHACR